jgi:hypothetical protein
MQATQAYICAALAVMIGDLVRPASRSNVYLDDDQVWLILQIKGFYMFILDFDFGILG